MEQSRYAFYTADAFTDRPYQGAQIAVLPQAEGLDAGQMQRIAFEMNLSESVFVTRSEETNGRPTFRLRVFTPTREIEFAGHPTIAAGAVLASAGEIDLSEGGAQVIFEQNRGPLTVHIDGAGQSAERVQFGMSVKPTSDRYVPRAEEIAAFLGIDVDQIDRDRFRSMMVSCEHPYLIVPLRSREAVRAAKFDYDAWAHSSAPTIMADEILLFATKALDPVADFHARLVGPRIAPGDDLPVGSSIPAFAAYLCEHDHIARGTLSFSVERGTLETRHSILHVEMDNEGQSELEIRVGGPAVLISEGSILAPPSRD